MGVSVAGEVSQDVPAGPSWQPAVSPHGRIIETGHRVRQPSFGSEAQCRGQLRLHLQVHSDLPVEYVQSRSSGRSGWGPCVSSRDADGLVGRCQERFGRLAGFHRAHYEHAIELSGVLE